MGTLGTYCLALGLLRGQQVTHEQKLSVPFQDSSHQGRKANFLQPVWALVCPGAFSEDEEGRSAHSHGTAEILGSKQPLGAALSK